MSNFVILTPEEQELYHHGVLGQKWGVRRYQNPDGSLKANAFRRAKANRLINKRDGGYIVAGNKKREAYTKHLSNVRKMATKYDREYAKAKTEDQKKDVWDRTEKRARKIDAKYNKEIERIDRKYLSKSKKAADKGAAYLKSLDPTTFQVVDAVRTYNYDKKLPLVIPTSYGTRNGVYIRTGKKSIHYTGQKIVKR